jgi:hypothetical protein
MQPLRIEIGVADAPGAESGAHRPADRGVRIKGIKAQLRIGKFQARWDSPLPQWPQRGRWIISFKTALPLLSFARS